MLAVVQSVSHGISGITWQDIVQQAPLLVLVILYMEMRLPSMVKKQLQAMMDKIIAMVMQRLQNEAVSNNATQPDPGDSDKSKGHTGTPSNGVADAKNRV